MRLADAVPGAAYDASPLARVQPGALPTPAQIAAPAALVQGAAFIPVPGPKGDPGIAGAAGGVSFQQMTPSTLWTIQHNLNRYPTVTVIDSAGSQVYGEVQYVNSNQLTVAFSSAFSGTAALV